MDKISLRSSGSCFPNFVESSARYVPVLLYELFIRYAGNKVALADHDEVTFAVIESHFSFVPHSEFQESRNQWEFQSGTNEK